MAEKSIPIRTALMPLYYKDFHCIMGACQDNCCDDGWKIAFDKKDYLTIKRAPKSAELERMMNQGMRRLRAGALGESYAEFYANEHGRCAFHTPDGLCQLQLECGEQTLPQVCRVFPRKSLYSTAALERSLSPACEGVLALLWDLPEGIDFWEEPLPKKEWRAFTPSHAAEARFAAIRALCIDALQERSMKLPQRLLMIGVLLQQLRNLDWNDGKALDSWLEQGGQLLHTPDIARQLSQLPRNRKMFITNNLHLLSMLRTGRKVPLSQELLEAITEQTQQKDGEMVFPLQLYQKLEEKLEELLKQSEAYFENLMVTVAFHVAFPALGSPEVLWGSYVSLCNLYSYYRFASVCAMDQEVSRERLFHACVHVSRIMIHSPDRFTASRDEFFQNDSATLAHMAILLDG